MDSGDCPFRGPVADLVDPYATKDTAGASVRRLTDWLDAHPGRWALFVEGEQGVDIKNLSAAGYEVTQRTSKTTRVRKAYVRLPHPEGESLEEALARGVGGAATYPADLPDLAKDSFGWTKEELAAAVQAARESLFPVRADSRSGRRKQRTTR